MPHQRTFLIVEDDPDLAAAVAESLAEEGYRVLQAGSIAAAKALLGKETAGISAVLLDVGLPDGEGWDLCAWIRRAGMRMPVIMMTGLADEHCIVRGFEVGADDYVTKPFSFSVLSARLRAQLRAWDSSEAATFTLGPWLINYASRTLVDRATGRKLRLTSKESSMLRRLSREHGGAVSKAVLLREIWGYVEGVSSHTLETHVYRLRQKIEVTPSAPKLLLSTDGGYRLATDAFAPAETDVPIAAHAA